MKVYENISLLPYNTFGIDVKARRMLVLERGADEACPYADEARQLCSEGVANSPTLILGMGSNVVFTGDYDGTIVRLSDEGRWQYCEDGNGGALLLADAGMVLDQAIGHSIEHGYYGMENLSAIPGTVGASAVQNVGAYGVEAKDVIVGVEAFDLASGELRTLRADECRYGYRDSIFKHEANRWLITRVSYQLSTRYEPRLGYRALDGLPCGSATDLRQAITDLRWQKLPRTWEYGSAGSFFKNPIVDATLADELRRTYPDMPLYGGNKLSAGWLIDRCGWKGRTMERAGVWPRQALVLYNTGGCTGGEVVALAQAIQADVQQKFGILLEPEAIII